MSKFMSPTLAKLALHLKAGKTSALKIFWEEQAKGTPLIEPLEDQEKFLVTFVYRNKDVGNHILLLGCPANLDASILYG